jgi:hypothetical protein
MLSYEQLLSLKPDQFRCDTLGRTVRKYLSFIYHRQKGRLEVSRKFQK